MFAAAVITKKLTKACGHTSDREVSYRTTEQLNATVRGARLNICEDCKATLEKWVSATHGLVSYPLLETPLKGSSDAQIKYGRSVRSALYRQIGPLMTFLATHEDPLAKNLWRAIYLYIDQPYAKEWIGRKGMSLDMRQLTEDVSLFFCPRFKGEPVSEHSLYMKLRQRNPLTLCELGKYEPIDGLRGKCFIKPHP